jgi:hypothetical protein
MEALGGGLFEEMVQTPLGNCSLNTQTSLESPLISNLLRNRGVERRRGHRESSPIYTFDPPWLNVVSTEQGA